MINRSRVQLIHENAIPSGIDLQTSPAIPAGQTWQITRIIFADKSIGDGLSGGFKVDWGSGSTFEVLAAAYLEGNTIDLPINKVFTGDSVKHFRLIRQNNSAPNKEMFIMVEGFQRIGDL